MQEMGYTGFLVKSPKRPRDKDLNASSLVGRWSQKLTRREVRWARERGQSKRFIIKHIPRVFGNLCGTALGCLSANTPELQLLQGTSIPQLPLNTGWACSMGQNRTWPAGLRCSGKQPSACKHLEQLMTHINKPLKFSITSKNIILPLWPKK